MGVLFGFPKRERSQSNDEKFDTTVRRLIPKRRTAALYASSYMLAEST